MALALLERATGLAVSAGDLRQAAEHGHTAQGGEAFWVLPVDKEDVARTRAKIHTKLVMAQALANGNPECHGINREPCRRVLDLLAILIDASTGTEPPWGFLTQIRFMLGLSFWLYNPGPNWCFVALDKNKDGQISWSEFQRTFARVDKTLLIFEFIDTNQDDAITKGELLDYLRAAVNVRELVPDVDEVDPQTSSDIVMAKLDGIVDGPTHRVSRSGDGSRLSLIKCLCVVCLVVFIVAIYIFCVRSEGDERQSEKDSKSTKDSKETK